MSPRRAKIVCTLGPATDDRCRALVEAGMDVARLNFSHGEHAEHGRRYQEVRRAAEQAGRNVAVLADLQGPKIRIGRFAEGPVEWASGERVRITVEDVEGSHDRVGTTYKQLAEDVKPGDRLLVDDGNVALVAVEIDGPDVVCDVTEGGMVSNNKGLSLPGVAVSVPALSEKDADDLEFALRLGADYIALSFVRHPEDIKLVQMVMDKVGIHRPVIAKIEKPEAVDRLEEIVLAFDGVMVARGDLGVEMPLEMVPVVQKRAVQMCRDMAKPVIVATQMLESMITHSRPTRAEASDVANAVIDGADAVMLSGETSVGQYPVQAVATMDRIIRSVEAAAGVGAGGLTHNPRTSGGAIAKAAADIGNALGAVALVAFTQTGDTARRLSRLQPEQQLLVFTPVETVQRQMALLWGAQAHLVWEVKTTDEMVRQVDSALINRGVCRQGDLVVVVAGTPPATPGATNTIRVHHIGDIVRHDN